MSETTYVPRAGSKAEAAVAALQQRKWLCAADLALEIGRDLELGSTGDPLARDVEDEEGKPVSVQKHRKTAKARPAQKPRATPAKRQAPAEPVNVRGVMYEHAVGILEDGTIVIIDAHGHAMSLPAVTARRVAELVARTA